MICLACSHDIWIVTLIKCRRAHRKFLPEMVEKQFEERADRFPEKCWSKNPQYHRFFFPSVTSQWLCACRQRVKRPRDAVRGNYHELGPNTSRFLVAEARRVQVFSAVRPFHGGQNAAPRAGATLFGQSRTGSRPAVLAEAVRAGQGAVPPRAIRVASGGAGGALLGGREGCRLPARQPGSAHRALPSTVHRQHDEE